MQKKHVKVFLYFFTLIAIAVFAVSQFSTSADAGDYCIQGVCFSSQAKGGMVTLLHNGNSDYGVALNLYQNQTGNNDGPKLEFKKTLNSAENDYERWTMGILNGTNNFGISSTAGRDIGFGRPRFILAHDGKAGINEANPQYPLDVNGALRLSMDSGSGTGEKGVVLRVREDNNPECPSRTTQIARYWSSWTYTGADNTSCDTAYGWTMEGRVPSCDVSVCVKLLGKCVSTQSVRGYSQSWTRALCAE